MFADQIPGEDSVSSLLGSTVRARSRRGTREGEETVESFDRLKKLVAEAEDDIMKAEGGNKAAGTRARQTMQEIKNAAQEVREKVLELRDAGKPE